MSVIYAYPQAVTLGSAIIDDEVFLRNVPATEAELENKKYLDELILNVQDALGFPEIYIDNNEIEVLEILQPRISVKYLFLQNYMSTSLPRWFQPQNLPSLKSLTFAGCFRLKNISSPFISQNINSNEIPAVGNFLSLTDLTIDGCHVLLSLEHFLHPDYVPAIKKIRIEKCSMLASVPTEKFGDLHFLEELYLVSCPNIRLQKLVSQSLEKLRLWDSGLFCNIDCCSLAYFNLSCEFVTSIQLQMWSSPALRELRIECKSLTSIGGSIAAFSSLNALTVTSCVRLSTLDDLITPEYLPAIEKIHIEYCLRLLSLPGERFRSFPSLKDVVINQCQSLNWQRGLVLPSCLQRLRLERCGDIFPYVPSCLQNLTSLVSLSIGGCKGIRSIPGNIWCSNLASLEELRISDCPDLV